MTFILDKASYFWNYLSDGQKGLIEEGIYLMEDTKLHPDARITDYSYLVFPFAKAYEGFLKQLFLDLGFISEKDYGGDHFRIGRVLNPLMKKTLGNNSIYAKMEHTCGNGQLAYSLWDAWKIGRNQTCHYFPHNLRALSYEEADAIISQMLSVMQESVTSCKVKKV